MRELNLPVGLIDAVDQIITGVPQGLSEYDLMLELDQQYPDLFPKPDLADPLLLFQHHFVLMHILYRLQQTSEPSARQLSISPLRIQWQIASSGDGNALQEDSALGAYYLDFTNLAKEDGGSVESMLEGFWHRVLSGEQSTDALSTLGLARTATFTDIKSRYRKLAHEHHPDKGGDPASFDRIQQAYETLKSSHRRRSS